MTVTVTNHNSTRAAVDGASSTLPLAAGLTRDYLLHHRLCPKAINDDGVLVVAATGDALRGGADDVAYAYRRAITYEMVERAELERLVERLTTRAERTVELARVDTNSDDLATGWSKLRDVLAQTVTRVENVPDPAWQPKRFYKLVTPSQ